MTLPTADNLAQIIADELKHQAKKAQDYFSDDQLQATQMDGTFNLIFLAARIIEYITESQTNPPWEK